MQELSRRASLSVPALALLACVVGGAGCTEKRRAAQPEPADAAPSASLAVVSPSAAPPASASARPGAATSSSAPAPPAELSGAVLARVEKWKARAAKRKSARAPYPVTAEAIQLETSRHGAFDVIAASIPTPVMAGGAEDTHEMLVVTAQGERELPNAPEVIGLVDADGDGRADLVLKDVTVIADRPNGPYVLRVADRGGAYGWRTVRIATFEDKPALVATTETNTTHEVGVLRAGGYLVEESRGILEEVTLRWNGHALAAVLRKPLETQADAEARQRQFAEAARAEAALRAPARR